MAVVFSAAVPKTAQEKAVFLKVGAPVAQGRKIKELTLRLDHLYYPAEELIFKDSNNVACLACTF